MRGRDGGREGGREEEREGGREGGEEEREGGREGRKRGREGGKSRMGAQGSEKIREIKVGIETLSPTKHRAWKMVFVTD